MLEKIRIIKDDITNLKVDAIVNAADNLLLGGGGVDGAIHQAAGPELLQECRTLKGCATGEAKITSGYDLPAEYVIHTVGPVWRGGKQKEAQMLASCYRNSLKLAEENNLKSVAFPAISCGIYGYPLEEAAQIALHEAASYLKKNTVIEQIIIVCFSEKMYRIYEEKLEDIL